MSLRKLRVITLAFAGVVLLGGIVYGGYRQFRVHSQRFVREAEGKLKVGDLDGAIAALQHHVVSHPSDIDARLKLGELLRKVGNHDSAARVYEQLRTDIEAMKKANKRGAREFGYMIEESSEADVGFAFARDEQAKARFAAADWNQAASYFRDEVDIFRGIKGLEDNEAQARFNAASAYFNGRLYDSAKAELDSVANLFPDWDSTRVVQLRGKIEALERRGVIKPVSLEDFNRRYE